MGQLTILPESEGGTLYAGGTAWDAVFAQFAELKTLLKQARDQGGPLPESGPQMATWIDPPSNVSYLPAESFHTHADDEIVGANELTSCFPFNNCTPPTMPEVISLLPSTSILKKLIDKVFQLSPSIQQGCTLSDIYERISGISTISSRYETRMDCVTVHNAVIRSHVILSSSVCINERY